MVRDVKSISTLTLTFDDGPHPVNTPKILTLLNKHKINAIFCVLGKQCLKYPKILNRIKKEGHLIANHTFSHKNLQKISFKDAVFEIEKCEKIIFKRCGIRTKLFRFPYGRSTPELRTYLHNKGYRILGWDVDTRDWEHHRKNHIKKICTSLRSSVKKGGILLMHDLSNYSFKALDKTLPNICSSCSCNFSVNAFKHKIFELKNLLSIKVSMVNALALIHSKYSKMSFNSLAANLKIMVPVSPPSYMLNWKPSTGLSKNVNHFGQANNKVMLLSKARRNYTLDTLFSIFKKFKNKYSKSPNISYKKSGLPILKRFYYSIANTHVTPLNRENNFKFFDNIPFHLIRMIKDRPKRAGPLPLST